MKGSKIIKEFLISYVKTNFDIDICIKNEEDGYLINISKNEFIKVIYDVDFGWHCFGNVNNIPLSEKIEYEFETFFNSINESEKSLIYNSEKDNKKSIIDLILNDRISFNI